VPFLHPQLSTQIVFVLTTVRVDLLSRSFGAVHLKDRGQAFVECGFQAALVALGAFVKTLFAFTGQLRFLGLLILWPNLFHISGQQEKREDSFLLILYPSLTKKMFDESWVARNYSANPSVATKNQYASNLPDL
jgi:hypothetical protein